MSNLERERERERSHLLHHLSVEVETNTYTRVQQAPLDCGTDSLMWWKQYVQEKFPEPRLNRMVRQYPDNGCYTCQCVSCETFRQCGSREE
jgi:hypothetical protein